jgi:Bacterial protein of unknown function (DUF922)
MLWNRVRVAVAFFIEAVPEGTTSSLTITLHEGLVYRLPTLSGYASAPAASKAEWDRKLGELRAHEDRRLAIAIEGGDRLAQELVGKDINKLARMALRQMKPDRIAKRATKPGEQYDDVSFDTSICDDASGSVNHASALHPWTSGGAVPRPRDRSSSTGGPNWTVGTDLAHDRGHLRGGERLVVAVRDPSLKRCGDGIGDVW